jgi:hypothetical protein
MVGRAVHELRLRAALQSDRIHLQAWLASSRSTSRPSASSAWSAALHLQILVGAAAGSLPAALLGRRRGWILVLSGCLASGIGVMGFCSPTGSSYVLGASRCWWFPVRLAGHRDRCLSRGPFPERARPSPPRRQPSATARRPCWRRRAGLIAASVGWRLAFSGRGLPHGGRPWCTTVRAPEPREPGRPPRTLADAVWHPLRESAAVRRARGDFCCWCCSTRWAMPLPEPLQRLHDQRSRILAGRTQHRRQGEHDDLDHDRREPSAAGFTCAGACSARCWSSASVRR